MREKLLVKVVKVVLRRLALMAWERGVYLYHLRCLGESPQGAA